MSPWVRLCVSGCVAAATVSVLVASPQRRGTPPPTTTGQRGTTPPPTTGQRGTVPTPPAGGQTDPQGQQVFRSNVNLVPVDVRVIDRDGKPVTDLRENEFVVTENNIRQQVRHFSTTALTASEASAKKPLNRFEDAPTIGAQDRRVFLIVFGRGRLQEPGKGVDAALDLIKNRLLPQDYVGIMAWNRATDFTTDREKALAVVDRFKKSHEKIEALLKQHFSGLTAVYGGSEIPAPIQREIDAVFNGPVNANTRTLTPEPVTNSSRMAGDSRRINDAMQTQAINAATGSSMVTSLGDSAATLGLGMDLDEFVEVNAQSMQDIGNLYTGINYLKHIAGEKNLLFVTNRGVFAPRAEDDRSIAAAASDARVVMDILHTGGTDPRGNIDWSIQTSQTVSQLTGGQFTSTQVGPKFMERIDVASRFQYTLGYYPTNSVLDGQYRRIQVRVLRPGGPYRVLYRHGYFARQFESGFDRQRMLTYSRVTSAATYATEVRDLAITATATPGTAADGSRTVTVDVQIPPQRLAFAETDGKRKGALDVAVFVADASQRLVGVSWDTVQVEMTPDAFARFQQKGFTYHGTVTASAVPKHIKIVVYDLGADLIGSVMMKLK